MRFRSPPSFARIRLVRLLLLLALGGLWGAGLGPVEGAQRKGKKPAPAGKAGQGRVTPAAVDQAIQRGVSFLVAEAKKSGAHRSPGQQALNLYAMVKGGLSADDPMVRESILSMALSPLTGSYDRACAILALNAVDKREHRDWIHALANGLVRDQNQEGGWGYPHGEDLSNIQYAALGLWAAERAGFEVPEETWLRLAQRIDNYSASGGGFGYSVRSGSSYGSMTAAGIGVIAILKSQLSEKQLGRRLKARLDGIEEKALGWLGRHFRSDDNPGRGGVWIYYYLYGLERVGGLAGVERIGQHDWYQEGAEFLLRTQESSGAWPGGAVQTAFGILFLKRATRPLTGQGSVRRGGALTAGGKDSPFTLVASGDTPLSLWISGWNEKLVGDMVWSGDEGRGPRVLRVEYLAGPRVLQASRGSRSEPAGDQRFAVRHSFRAPGEYVIRARAQLLGPRTKDESGRVQAGEIRLVESPPITVQIDEVVPDWMLQQRADRRQGLMRKANPEAKASSVHGGGSPLPERAFSAELAVDGLEMTPWLAHEGDERPTLSLFLRQGMIADTVLVFGARSTPHQVGYFSRPLEVEVSINDGEFQRLRMHVDERRAGRLELRKPLKIRKIEIAIPWSAPGDVLPIVGIAEVDVLRRPKK